MASREVLQKTFLEIVDNQLRDNTPPETKQTLDRLMKEGWSKLDAKKWIAHCVSIEVFRVMKYGEEFDEERYKTNLANLPKDPVEDED